MDTDLMNSAFVAEAVWCCRDVVALIANLVTVVMKSQVLLWSVLHRNMFVLKWLLRSCRYIARSSMLHL